MAAMLTTMALSSSSSNATRLGFQARPATAGSWSHERALSMKQSRISGRLVRSSATDAVVEDDSLPSEEAAASSALPLPQQKIRVKLRAYFAEYVDEATRMVVEAAKNTGAEIMGPVPLPTTRRVYCLLRSPHVNKNSMEHWEIRTHKRLLDIKNPNPRTIDALMQLDIRTGVDIEVKL